MKHILEKLISYKTTADNPEEIRRGFEYISSLFAAKKFEIQNFEKNGKYSQLISFPGKDAMKPKILLSGHFDVVPAEDESQYSVKIEGSKAYGRGTADMKGMLVVLIEVMRELGSKRNPPDVALLATADEEIGGEDGVGYVVRELGIRPEFVLCADATNEKREIVVKEKGGLWLELQAQGKTAHAAYLWQGENALVKIVEAIAKIKNFIGPTEAEAWKSTLNIARIETSNTTPNKVPADAKAILDIRFTEELAKTPDEIFLKIQAATPEVTLRVLTKVPLLFVEEQNPFLQKFQKISQKVCGERIPFGVEHGATDARYFGEIGIPAIIFGAVGGNFHAAAEWVDLGSLKANYQILLTFLSKR